MDFLSFNPQFKALICTRCEYALVPTAIAAHLNASHKAELTLAEIKSCVQICKTRILQ
jgi:RNase P subunit RPR2